MEHPCSGDHDSTAAVTQCILAQVVCQGSNVDHLIILSLLEGLQSYAACRGLDFLGCNFGDEALQAVVGLMQKSCGKWWTGPKIQLLEITAQQHEQPSAGMSLARSFKHYYACGVLRSVTCNSPELAHQTAAPV